MSKVEGRGVRLTPPAKASCNYFFLEASRVKYQKLDKNISSLIFYQFEFSVSLRENLPL